MNSLRQTAVRAYIRVVTKVSDIRERLRDDRGQGLVEYGLIIALVAIVLVAALVALTGGLKGVFGNITGTLNNSTSTSS